MKTTPAVAGVVATAASVNTTYAAIATETAILSDVNTQTEWCTFPHVDSTTDDSVFNTDVGDFRNSTDSFVLASSVYVVIDLGGVAPVRMTYAPAITFQYGNELVRVHADINVDSIGDVVIPNIMGSDQDCFFLQLWYRDGGGVYHAFPQEWAYSVTNYTEFDVTVVTFPTAPNHDFSGLLASDTVDHPRHRLRCSVTGFIPVVAAGIDRIELRGRIDTLANLASVTLKEATMCSVMVRH